MWSLVVFIIILSICVNTGYDFDEMIKFDGLDFIKSVIDIKNKISKFFRVDINKYMDIVFNTISNVLQTLKQNELWEIKFGSDNFEISHPMKLNTSIISPFLKLARQAGFDAETHVAVTKDGYVLTIHRLVMDSLNTSPGRRGVVLLYHGILGSSNDWVLLGPNKALPYLLIHAGYDVWLANARGNIYSKTHVGKTLQREDGFWDFSWHEIGVFDLPAVIDYIRDRYNKTVSFNFVGHSLGATALFVLLSTFPQYNHILRTGVLMAPLAFMHEVRGPLRVVAEFYEKLNLSALRFLQMREFETVEAIQTKLIEKFCSGDNELCRNPLLMLTNSAQSISKALRSKILQHSPGGGSMKTITHYIQLVKSDYFQMFDYGRQMNKGIYGVDSPSKYNLKSITLPLTFISSKYDCLSTEGNIKRLMKALPTPVTHHVIPDSRFTHMDFMWAENADIYSYYTVLDTLNSEHSGN